ncbi:MAG: CvpA family protein [Planctomycetes bacterium]|nr:CvpA family protein [Planctomycetota bacterium]
MVFWAGILVAVLFAYSAIKLGFYHAWTMLFNFVIAVYVAIRISPAIEGFLPAAMGSGQYGKTMALLATGLVTFLVLHGIAYTLLIGQFEVTFPRIVNTLGSGILGFLAGFLIWSFGTLIVCTTPFCQKQYVKELGFETKTFQEAKMQSYLIGWCNFLDKIVASGDNPVSAEQAIKDLLIKPAKNTPADIKTRAASIRPVDPNDPNKPYGPNQPPATESHTVIPP